MSVQENLLTAKDFATTWNSSPPWVMEEGVRSVYFETNRLDHNYPFFIDKDGTFVCNPENPSEKFYFKNIMDRYSYIGRKELRVFEMLEEKAAQNEGGEEELKFTWFTPIYPGKYPCSKVIFHTVINEPGTKNKTILNLVKVFDLSANYCVQIAREIFPELKGVNDADELRSLLIPTKDSQIQELIEIIDELNKYVQRPDSLLTEQQLSERAKIIVKMVRSNVSPHAVALEMNKLELLGRYSISCPPTFSELITGMDKYGSLEFRCPHPDCRRMNRRQSNMLISNCQHCGKVIPRC